MTLSIYRRPFRSFFAASTYCRCCSTRLPPRQVRSLDVGILLGARLARTCCPSPARSNARVTRPNLPRATDRSSTTSLRRHEVTLKELRQRIDATATISRLPSGAVRRIGERTISYNAGGARDSRVRGLSPEFCPPELLFSRATAHDILVTTDFHRQTRISRLRPGVNEHARTPAGADADIDDINISGYPCSDTGLSDIWSNHGLNDLSSNEAAAIAPRCARRRAACLNFMTPTCASGLKSTQFAI